jgi:hypothetical protein
MRRKVWVGKRNLILKVIKIPQAVSQLVSTARHGEAVRFTFAKFSSRWICIGRSTVLSRSGQTKWLCRRLSQKLVVSQWVRKFSLFWGSKQPATCPCPEPDQSSPRSPSYLRSVSNLSSHLRLGFSSGLFLLGFRITVVNTMRIWDESRVFYMKSYVKAVPLQAWSGPEGSRKLRFPDYMTTAQDGG